MGAFNDKANAFAEAMQEFGEDLQKLLRRLEAECKTAHPALVERVNAIPNQDHLDTVAAAFVAEGDRLQQEIWAEDERRDQLSSFVRGLPLPAELRAS